MGTAPRKAPQRAGQKAVRCLFCNSTQDDHNSQICTRFHPRPCKCGHAHSLHEGRCKGFDYDTATARDKACKCSGYREDPTPSEVLRRQVKAGEYQLDPVAQLEDETRPADGTTLKSRVWAYLKLRTAGQTHPNPKRSRGRIAMIYDPKTGAIRWLRPSDILHKMRSLEGPAPTTDKKAVSRVLGQLEDDGKIRMLGSEDGVLGINSPRRRLHTHIAVYCKPVARRRNNRSTATASQSGPSATERYKEDPFWGANLPPKCSDLVEAKPVTDTLSAQLLAEVVKLYCGKIREAVASDPDLGGKFAPQNLEAGKEKLIASVLECWDLALFGGQVCPGLGGKSARAYKEDQDSDTRKSSEDDLEPSSSSSFVEGADHAPEPTTTEFEPIEEALRECALSDGDAPAHIHWRCRDQDPECTAAEIGDVIRQKRKSAMTKDNPIGYLITYVPKAFANGGYQARRREVRAAREREQQQQQVSPEFQEFLAWCSANDVKYQNGAELSDAWDRFEAEKERSRASSA